MTAATSDAVTSGYAGRAIWGAFIGGAFAATGDEETFAVTEPATGRPLARVVSGGAGLVDRAVAEARRAYPGWRDTPPRERGRLLRLVAAKIRAHAEELADLEAREVGKPRRDALRFDVSYCSPRLAVRGGQGQRVRPRERRGDAARIRPLEEHPLPVRPRHRAGLAASGLTARRGTAREGQVTMRRGLRRPRGRPIM